METLSIGKLNCESFAPFVEIHEQPMMNYPWTEVDGISLTEIEQNQLKFITQKLLDEPAHLLNEATIWARAIYPLLLLGEQGAIRARFEAD